MVLALVLGIWQLATKHFPLWNGHGSLISDDISWSFYDLVQYIVSI